MKTRQEMESELVMFFNTAAARAVDTRPDGNYRRQYTRNACEIVKNIVEARADQIKTDDRTVNDLGDIDYDAIEEKLAGLYKAMSECAHRIGVNSIAMEYREVSSQVYSSLIKVQMQREKESELKSIHHPRAHSGKTSATAKPL